MSPNKVDCPDALNILSIYHFGANATCSSDFTWSSRRIGNTRGGERNPIRQHPDQPSVNAARRPLIGRLDRHQIVRHVRLGRGRRPELCELKPGSFSALERK